MKSFLVPYSLLVLPFIVIATANSAGYRYGASDQAFYAPAAMQRLDEGLFPRDTALLNAQARLTFADESVATLARLTGGRLPPLFAALYVLGLLLVAAAVFWLGRVLFDEPWTTAALLAAMSLRHAIARAGTNTLEGYFHPRQLAFGLGALAVCAFLQRRHATLVALLAGAAALHPTTTLWFAVWIYVAVFVAEPRWRSALGAVSLAVVPLLWWAFSYGPLAGRLVRMDSDWLEAIAGKEYLFPLGWPLHAWLLNLGYPVIVLTVWRIRRAAGAVRPRENALAAGCLSLLGIFAIALTLQSRGLALAIQLQPARIFWMLDFMATVYLVWLLCEGIGVRHVRRAIAVAALIALFAVARGVYIMQVQFPDRPLARFGIADDDWGRVMSWARGTDRGSGWLADPLHAARFGTSVRVAARRDVFVEALKDSALGMYDRGVAIRTRDRLAELRDFPALTADRARGLARKYALDYLVTEAVLDLPSAFRSGPLHVYRLRD